MPPRRPPYKHEFRHQLDKNGRVLTNRYAPHAKATFPWWKRA